MSLLSQLAQQAAGGILGNVFGANNRSLQGDCLDISDTGSYAAKLAKYPQCAPYINASGPSVGLPGSGMLPAPYTGFPTVPQASVVPIAYQSPMLPAAAGMLPMIGGMLPKVMQMLPKVSGVAGTALSVIKKNLPTLNKSIAIASGYVVAAGLVYDQAGNLVGKTRRRRRINPLNYRAAMRAASRLCKVHDLTARISQALPAAGSARAPRRRRKRRKC